MKEEPNREYSLKLMFAMVPFLGYLAGYCYEVAFAQFYGLPSDIVAVDLLSILKATVALLISFSSVYYLLSGIITPVIALFEKLTWFWKIVAYINFFILFLYSLIYWFVGFSFKSFLSCFYLIIFANCYSIIPVWIQRKLSKDNRTFAESASDSLANDPCLKIERKFLQMFDGIPLKIFLSIFLSFFFPVLIGHNVAKTKKEFFVSVDGTKIIISHYNNLWAVKEFDLERKLIKNVFYLWTNEDMSKKEFKLELLNSLQIEK